jgi:outer membrane receptor for ferrienterochelin and colicins
MKQKPLILLALCCWYCSVVTGQSIRGEIQDALSGEPIAMATIRYADTVQVLADKRGQFSITTDHPISLTVSAAGYETATIRTGQQPIIRIYLVPIQKQLEGVVITGTLKAVQRSESPVAVEVYTPQFLKKNPSPSIFESLQNVNGVRPQLNCSVCNTGDIHINGLEGPYTLVAIDGMHVMSSLASVYGLFGIPTQLIDRIEIVKGPASGLYGPEAIGGMINIITRSPDKAPLLTTQLMSSSWKEHSFDAGLKLKLGKKISALTGIHYFNYQDRADHNHDRFTDMALQHRVSVFQKLQWQRKQDRLATIAGRYFYEDRWGGDTRWSKPFRGTDSVYGESIYTSRWELFGQYQLPLPEKLLLSFSATGHQQDSYYGQLPYLATQRTGFAQLTWDKKPGAAHSLLTGIALRSNFYDDNSTATRDTLTGRTQPDKTLIPGLFIQDEWKLNGTQLLLLGMRIDHHPVHRSIFTPRIAWKWIPGQQQVVRINAGTGFRVVNLFTEEHAALTGARVVEIQEALRPERSYNINLNYTRSFKKRKFSLQLDASAWYSYFSNQILPDYDTDPDKIIYKNLDGFAHSEGMTLNLDVNYGHRFKALAGITLQSVQKTERDNLGKKVSQLPVLTEKWSGTWSASYTWPATGWSVDYTGNIYGPMRLPLLGERDPRPAYSPVWSLQNIQSTKKLGRSTECFAGIKNILNWTPARKVPFLIARSHDPFDKNVQYEADGSVKVTAENPYGLSFDPAYVYAPNQGRRIFAGIRYTIR